ncbi:MAG: hypothetical protein NZL90_03435 [Aquificaceae bacterium]|nr:hypothetical protein [Aquificaceae bacterium]MDW8237583.1 hypothetical protein [Aquificaceae bacterium]
MQQKVRSRLEFILKNSKLPSSILISGPSGSGKILIATELCSSLLCFEKSYPPCGKCPSCRLLRGIIPPKLGVEKHLNELSHPDFYCALAEKSEIKIDQIRTILSSISLKPALSSAKVALIYPADNMNVFAQNALLKTLEEPPKDSYIILVSNNPESLLKTVRSRLFEVRCPPLSDEELSALTGISDSGLINKSRASALLLKKLKEKPALLELVKNLNDPVKFYKSSQELEKLDIDEQSTVLTLLSQSFNEKAIKTKNIELTKKAQAITELLANLGKGLKIGPQLALILHPEG